jgi:hypothetical protein
MNTEDNTVKLRKLLSELGYHIILDGTTLHQRCVKKTRCKVLGKDMKVINDEGRKYKSTLSEDKYWLQQVKVEGPSGKIYRLNSDTHRYIYNKPGICVGLSSDKTGVDDVCEAIVDYTFDGYNPEDINDWSIYDVLYNDEWNIVKLPYVNI